MRHELGSELNHGYFLNCCQETQKELLRVGLEKCKGLKDDTQLSAVILLLARCFSILQAMPPLLSSEALDVYDSARRSLSEAWLLAFQFRFKDKHDKAKRWLDRRDDSWKADKNALIEFANSRRADPIDLKKFYSGLSRLAHPTRDAAENSGNLVAKLFGKHADAPSIETIKAKLELEKYEDLYRVLWLLLDQDTGFIALPIDDSKLPIVLIFMRRYKTRFIPQL